MQGMQKQRLVLGNGAGRRKGALGIMSWLCWDGAVVGRRGSNYPGRRRASAPEVCTWARWRHARTTRKDALGCAGGCAQLLEEKCARSRDDAWLCGVNLKLVLPRKADRPSGHGSPCLEGRMKVAVGLPAKEALTHLYGLGEIPLRLWLADEFLVFLSSLSAKVIDHVVGEVDYGGCA
ncbi:hypothetical protein CDL15_Pgr028753 [Punica granatum]|uniref:Uncharacterized protein n=1 Tax=Punica granatum TaxID=22663 RepID=A0A218VX30_PUNGR|nr:hypothetical protein CDL15_Pgr028753 [Punica granatum]